MWNNKSLPYVFSAIKIVYVGRRSITCCVLAIKKLCPHWNQNLNYSRKRQKCQRSFYPLLIFQNQIEINKSGKEFARYIYSSAGNSFGPKKLKSPTLFPNLAYPCGTVTTKSYSSVSVIWPSKARNRDIESMRNVLMQSSPQVFCQSKRSYVDIVCIWLGIAFFITEMD